MHKLDKVIVGEERIDRGESSVEPVQSPDQDPRVTPILMALNMTLNQVQVLMHVVKHKLVQLALRFCVAAIFQNK